MKNIVVYKKKNIDEILDTCENIWIWKEKQNYLILYKCITCEENTKSLIFYFSYEKISIYLPFCNNKKCNTNIYNDEIKCFLKINLKYINKNKYNKDNEIEKIIYIN